MPLGSFRINGIAKQFAVAVEAEVIRSRRRIIAVGDAKVSTAQSQFGGASALFGGSGDYLRTDPLPLGTGSVTVEAWIRTSAAVQQNIIGGYVGTGGGPGWILDLGSTGIARVRLGNNSATGTSSLNNNVWHHVAGVRDSTSIRLYVNGILEATISTESINLTLTSETRIGSLSVGFTRFFNGYIDEVRVSNSARYTSNFTPSTTPFVNDANTLLLLHMDGVNNSTIFQDDNGVRDKNGCIAYADTKISTLQSRFGGSSAFITTWTGTFNQSDHIRVDKPIIPASTDFTAESWIYTSDATTRQMAVLSQFRGSPTVGRCSLYITAGRNVEFFVGNPSGNLLITSPSAIALNQWHHLAVTRSGNDFKLWINGTNVVSSTNTATVLQDYFVVGMEYRGVNDPLTEPTAYERVFNGYIDEVRVSNTVRYTADFTPSTTPFVNDANTLLLLHMDGTNNSTVFEDDNGLRSKKSVIAFGNAQVSTAQSQFGGSSFLSDGTDDHLNVLPVIPYGTENFTAECWVRWYNAPNNSTRDTIMTNRQTVASVNNGSWDIGHFDGLFYMTLRNTAGTLYQISTPIQTGNTWFHFALVRNGNNFTLYRNGTSLISTNVATGSDFGVTHSTTIGNYRNGTTQSIDANIDEVRISNVARYTANFTSPSGAFVNDDNTLLLLHMDGPNGSTYFSDDNGDYLNEVISLSYSVTPAANNVNEGASLTFNVATAGVANSTTLFYTLTNAGDFATSSGSFVINSNAGSFSVTPTADNITEGAETFQAQIRTGSTSGPIVATSSSVTINDTSTSPYWYYFDTSSATGDFAFVKVAHDSTNNIMAMGRNSISEFTPSGSITYNKQFSNTSKVNQRLNKFGNNWVMQRFNNTAIRVNDGATTIAQQFNPTTTNVTLNGCVVDSANNMIYTGNGQTANRWLIHKVNSSNTNVWTRQLQESTNTNTGINVVVDGSNNVYSSGRINNAYTLLKFNSAGTIQWRRSNDGPTLSESLTFFGTHIYDLAVDPGGGNLSRLTKWDLNGNLQWQRQFDKDGVGIAVNANGIYVLVRHSFNTSPNNQGSFIIKYDQSGTWQWTRRFRASDFSTVSNSTFLTGISVNSDDTVITVVGRIRTGSPPSVDYRYIMNVPTDGSRLFEFTFGGRTWNYANETSGTNSSVARTSPAANVTTTAIASPLTVTIALSATTETLSDYTRSNINKTDI